MDENSNISDDPLYVFGTGLDEVVEISSSEAAKDDAAQDSQNADLKDSIDSLHQEVSQLREVVETVPEESNVYDQHLETLEKLLAYQDLIGVVIAALLFLSIGLRFGESIMKWFR